MKQNEPDLIKFFYGGISGVISRSCVAPLDKIKINIKTN